MFLSHCHVILYIPNIMKENLINTFLAPLMIRQQNRCLSDSYKATNETIKEKIGWCYLRFANNFYRSGALRIPCFEDNTW